MKASALNSMKFARLQAALETPHRGDVAGILEMLWQFAGANAITGAIGKFSNEEIFSWMGCRMHGRTPDEMMQLLVQCGWVDVHPVHRFVIHDWHDHCASFVKGNLARYGGKFANLPDDDERQPTPARSKAPAKAPAIATPIAPAKAPATYPILSKPIHSPPPSPLQSEPAAENANSREPVVVKEGDVDWTMIGARLSELGIVAWRNAVKACQDAGGTPAFAAAVIDHWARNPGAWNHGMLVYRLQQGPSVHPAQGWPTPAPAAVKSAEQAKKLAEDKERQDDTAFYSLVKAGRDKKVPDEAIIAAAIRGGLKDAAIRRGWLRADGKMSDGSEVPQTPQTPPTG